MNILHLDQEDTWLDIKTILALSGPLNFMKTQIFAKMTPKMTKSPNVGRIFSSKFRRDVEISIVYLFVDASPHRRNLMKGFMRLLGS